MPGLAHRGGGCYCVGANVHALLISERDAKDALAEDLRLRTRGVLEQRGYHVEAVAVGPADVVPCTGCLACHMHADGVCLYEDALTAVNARIGEFDLACVLGPIVFGQFGSTIKTVTDKLQTVRMQTRFVIAIGYGTDVSDEEAATFVDIVRKHGGAANVVHPRFKARNEVYVARSPGDNNSVCEALRKSL